MSDLATTQSLLHPRDVQTLTERKRQKESMLAGAGYGGSSPGLARIVTGSVQNPEAIVKEIREIDRVLEREAPKPIPSERLDEARKEEQALREKWLQGIPSQEEYRRNTPGSADKHRKWDRDNKADVLKWKHLRRRMHASGISDYGLDDESDVSNVEKYRPRGTSADLQDAQIPQTSTTMHQPVGAAPVAVLTDERAAALQELAPDILERIAMLSNEERASVFGLIDDLLQKPGEDKFGRYRALQKEAKALGIKTHGLKTEDLEKAISEARGA